MRAGLNPLSRLHYLAVLGRRIAAADLSTCAVLILTSHQNGSSWFQYLVCKAPQAGICVVHWQELGPRLYRYGKRSAFSNEERCATRSAVITYGFDTEQHSFCLLQLTTCHIFTESCSVGWTPSWQCHLQRRASCLHWMAQPLWQSC